MKRPDPASKKSFSPAEEEKLLRAARAYTLERFPNPTRTGCPTGDELGAIARREVPLAQIDRQVEHIATCSPCFAEYMAVHEKWKRRRRNQLIALSVAAIAAFVIVGFVWLRTPEPRTNAPTLTKDGQPKEREQLATLDLRPFEVSRGTERPGRAPALLGRGRVTLTILLPIGSEEGDYEFEIQDEKGASKVRGSAPAARRNYVTTIATNLDLRPLNPGRFTWAIRRVGETAWHTYPLEVR